MQGGDQPSCMKPTGNNKSAIEQSRVEAVKDVKLITGKPGKAVTQIPHRFSYLFGGKGVFAFPTEPQIWKE